eukprot:COSAG02_NODE_207_length_29119_cov_41.071365_22_plen_281_part_00
MGLSGAAQTGPEWSGAPRKGSPQLSIRCRGNKSHVAALSLGSRLSNWFKDGALSPPPPPPPPPPPASSLWPRLNGLYACHRIDGVTPPIFPNVDDNRAEWYRGCSQAVSCEGPLCCPSYEVSWSSTPFRVSTGRGGAVAASGSNHITIRDSVFRANEAPRGATLRISSTLSARIANTSIDEPPDEWSSAVSAFGASVATCFDNPCGTGSRCTFRDHSTSCEGCGLNEIGADGISCYACPPGTQPDALQAQCMPCASGHCAFGLGLVGEEEGTGCLSTCQK